MNKNVLIAAIVGVILLVGIGGFFLLGQKKSPEQASIPTTVIQTTPVNNQVVGGAKTLRDLLTSSTSQTCTFKDAQTSGSVQIGNGKMRGDFDSVVEGKSTTSHMIVDGQTFYMWIDGQTTGFKGSFDPADLAAGSGSIKDSFDPDKELDYQCQPGGAGSTAFAVPSTVTFQDMSSMMVPSGQSTVPQCAACDNLTGDAKAQCRSALKCQ